jgi:hypothetical protein
MLFLLQSKSITKYWWMQNDNQKGDKCVPYLFNCTLIVMKTLFSYLFRYLPVIHLTLLPVTLNCQELRKVHTEITRHRKSPTSSSTLQAPHHEWRLTIHNSIIVRTSNISSCQNYAKPRIHRVQLAFVATCTTDYRLYYPFAWLR